LHKIRYYDLKKKLQALTTGMRLGERKQKGQHPLTGQRAANFRLLANQ